MLPIVKVMAIFADTHRQVLMGKNKKGYNWKARSQLLGNVDLSQARLLEGKVLDKGDLRSQTGGYGGYEVSLVEALARAIPPG